MDEAKQTTPPIETQETPVGTSMDVEQQQQKQEQEQQTLSSSPVGDELQETSAKTRNSETKEDEVDEKSAQNTPLLRNNEGGRTKAVINGGYLLKHKKHQAEQVAPIHVSKDLDNWGEVAKAQLKQKVQEYKLKDIQWQDLTTKRLREVKIVTQNENGPCPLIALVNVLVLNGNLNIGPADKPTITDEELVGLLGDYLFRNEGLDTSINTVDESPKLSPGEGPSVDDISVILSLLPTLSHGLDVDLQFSHIYDFALTPATQLFKAFNVDLVHGWVVDPESERFLSSVLLNDCRNSYEGAVEFIFTADELSNGQVVEAQHGFEGIKHEQDDDYYRYDDGSEKESSKIKELFNRHKGKHLTGDQQQTVYNAVALNEWLNANATQLTEFGLRMLGTMLPNNHLCVFFRNNHFSTVYKRAPGELFILCTDAGVAGDDRIVWESLRDVNQMTSEFLDSKFCRLSDNNNSHHGAKANQASSSSQHHSQQQQQQQKQQQQHGANDESGSKGKGRDGLFNSGDYVQESSSTTAADGSSHHHSSQLDEDYALALTLQQEEEERLRQSNKEDRQKLQVRQQDKMPPGMDMKQHGHLYGVPVVTKEGEKKLAQAIFRTKSDENFSRHMADTFLPHESAARAKPSQYSKNNKSNEDRCVIC